jgi:hypothetical protein
MYGLNNSPIIGAYNGSGASLNIGGFSSVNSTSPNILATFQTDTGNVGIGTTTPGAKLDVAGAIKLSDTAQNCTDTGAIRYNSSSFKLQSCKNGTGWTDVGTGATAAPAGSDKQVQLNNNGVLYASSGLTFNSTSGQMTVTAGGSASTTGYFSNTRTSGATYGVYGTTASKNAGAGVYGTETGASNTGYAVAAVNNSASGWGVYSSGTSPNYFAGAVNIGTFATTIGQGTETFTPQNQIIEMTDTGVGAGRWAAAGSEAIVNPASDQPAGPTWTTGREMDGSVGYARIPPASTHNVNTINGLFGLADNYGTGNVTTMTGVNTFAYAQSNATVTTARGADLSAEQDAGTVTNLIGADVWSGTYGGATTSQKGLNVRLDNSGGTVINRYGLYLNTPTGSATNDYGIYQAGTQKNYFAGNVGIGTTTPSATLHLYRV